jgi:hypothetical protein
MGEGFFISPVGMETRNIHMASRGRFIAAVFEGVDKNAHRVYAALSFDGGRSFFDPVAIADVAAGMDHYPYIAVSGNGSVAVVWQNILPEDAKSRLFYSLSTDMGPHVLAARITLPSDTGFSRCSFTTTAGRCTFSITARGWGPSRSSMPSASDGATFDEPDIMAQSGICAAPFSRGAFRGRSFRGVAGKGISAGCSPTTCTYALENYGRSWSSPPV